ncbi:MAG: hypothetical protein PF518_05875 [Spirochaetaceae bacterium]|nr:hypothetical protein [Spirochaetaceae bacterium]
MNITMTKEEMVRLYQYLSSDYGQLDLPLKEFLQKLEKELFNSLTISQFQSLQKNPTGES